MGSKDPQPVFNSGPVANSQDEAKLIYSCVSDFSDGGPRKIYRDWLSEKGHGEKAAIVDASIQAYGDGKIGSLKNLPLDTSWSRLLGIPVLRTLIEQSPGDQEFHRLKTLILPNLKPALSMDYTVIQDAPAVGSTYLWGSPDLSPEAHWPILSECSDAFGGFEGLLQDIPCSFVGQFAWRDLAPFVLGQDVPETGGVSVFAFTEVNELGIMESVTRVWDPEGPLRRRTVPDGYASDLHGDGANGPFPAHAVQFTEVLSLPDATDEPFASLLPGFGWGEPGNDLYYALQTACGENSHGLGGYLKGTSGGDPSPDTDWLRLCVLRVTPDCGVLHFGIPAADLPAGKLERVRYVWMDWDG